ncbi:cytochrome b5 reductase 4 isoform X1 [Plutella xylostella]|uniref:cytochrome b5 reductase 4 isoform X1 n=1 Tax=Plutella xylostella TaxID=51655 RepID=UPI00203281FF|nr:cytochrome b5 reductase 4 isoform X1 [Plutella xylostella]XP_048480114.1 cytochrome b5 reductase 4 isoform X1 [Plutella xylostella]
MADPSRLIPDAPDPTPPMPTPNGSITMILPKVRCSSDSTTNDNSMSKSKPFVSSESKLSLPSNLGTPTSPLRLSSPLSLPASPTPFVRVTGSQPPPSTKSLGGSRQSSANTSTEDEAKERPVQPSINTGSATGNPRNKCALQPGHSLMDWIRLGNSGKDLTGVGGRIRPVSPRELAAHHTKNDAWLAIRGRVYNITHYLPFHPGGQEELMRGAGMDATQLFDKVHPWVNYDSLLAKCLVGPLCADRPDADELFGAPDPAPKPDRLREPSKAQELVRKSMENLANCITPVRKKISAKSEDNVKTANPSKIMQSLIMSSDLPVSISRRAGSSPVRSKSTSGDDTPSPLRFDWIQTSVKLTLSVYTGALANPGACARLAGGALLVEVATNGWLRVLTVEPEAKLKGPLQIKVYAESGKVEVTAQKASPSIWKDIGPATALPATRVTAPRALPCRLRAAAPVSHDTALLTLEPEPGPVAVPLGHHVKIHCLVNGEECVRSYTPVGEGWSPAGGGEAGGAGGGIRLAVKRYAEGGLSHHLTTLAVDDVITMSGPYGGFQLQKLRGVTTLHLVAAGTGVTPMLALLRFTLARSNPRCEKVNLLFFNKKEEDILFREKFDEIAKADSRFKPTYILSEPSPSWTGHSGRITTDLITEVLGNSTKCEDSCDHFACLCGPTEFTNTGVQMLTALGMRENCIHAFMG